MIQKRLHSIFNSPKFKTILLRNKVRKIAVFGSQATGRAIKNSDWDFLVDFEKDADLFDQIGLKQDLEKLFKKDVDIVTPRALNRYIRRRVLREAVYL